jgi:hypothetical protein
MATDPAPRLPHKIVAGSFHKTGTVLLNRLFRVTCHKLGWQYYHSKKHKGLDADWDIARVPRSQFSALVGDLPHRGVVIVRDPRDVIISAAHYHMKARERWLHRPRETLGGKTYQEHINSLPDNDARYLFEMENSGKKTIRAMLNWAEPPENITITRLETLATDYDFVEFRRIFEFLGFEGRALEVGLKVAREVSLFSRPEQQAKRAEKQAKRERLEREVITAPAEVKDKDQAKAEKKAEKKKNRKRDERRKRSAQPNVHVRSGGRPEQWRAVFTPAVLEAFHAKFADAPERLGYAPSLAPSEAAPLAA